jgi:hypothetical protein
VSRIAARLQILDHRCYAYCGRNLENVWVIWCLETGHNSSTVNWNALAEQGTCTVAADDTAEADHSNLHPRANDTGFPFCSLSLVLNISADLFYFQNLTVKNTWNGMTGWRYRKYSLTVWYRRKQYKIVFVKNTCFFLYFCFHVISFLFLEFIWRGIFRPHKCFSLGVDKFCKEYIYYNLENVLI